MKTNRKPPTAVSTVRNRERGSTFLTFLLSTLIVLATYGYCYAQLNITGNRYDLNRTAANLLESVLTTSNVQPSSFGNVGSYTVEGAIFAQPLYLSNVNISGAGTHNVLYVATMHDVVYAFDADHPDVFLWKRDFRGPGVSAATQNYGALLGDALGILSTPVIDIQSNRIFVVAATNEGNSTVYRIHSMDISSGADTVPAVQIEAAASGNSLDFPHDIQRAGLVLSNGQLYIAFSGNPEDTQPYHGWILTYDMNTLQPTGVFLTTIANGGAVWQSGGAPPVDSAENVYFLTGNGFDNKAVDGVSNFSQTLLKISHHSSSLSLVDWFAPSNWSFLYQFDLDLSCNGPMLIPGTDLIGFGSKNADIYLMHSNALGKLTPNDDHLVNCFT